MGPGGEDYAADEWSRPTTSPGSACLPNAFFENINVPSAVTSKTPPDDGIIVISTAGNAFLNSAANLTALGW